MKMSKRKYMKLLKTLILHCVSASKLQLRKECIFSPIWMRKYQQVNINGSLWTDPSLHLYDVTSVCLAADSISMRFHLYLSTSGYMV